MSISYVEALFSNMTGNVCGTNTVSRAISSTKYRWLPCHHGCGAGANKKNSMAGTKAPPPTSPKARRDWMSRGVGPEKPVESANLKPPNHQPRPISRLTLSLGNHDC